MDARGSGLIPALLIVSAGIIYGSLFPFRFSWPVHELVLHQFFQSWSTVNSLGDALGNIALFFPYGYLACVLSSAVKPRRLALALIVLGCLLALLCQVAQLITPGRDPSMFDLYMNALGAASGWVIGRLLPLGSVAEGFGGTPPQHLIVVTALLWPASLLLPFVPSIDPLVWRESVRPLFMLLHVEWQELLFNAACWLAFLHLLISKARVPISAIMMVLAVVAVIGLKIIIRANGLTFSFLLGTILGCLMWVTLRPWLRDEYVGAAVMMSFALYAIGPLAVRAVPRDFGWLPFQGYLQGSMLINALALFRKLFVFGAVALLVVEGRPRPYYWIAMITLALLLLELLQRSVGLGTPTLTDPLLFVVFAWFIHRQMRRYQSA